MSGWTDIWDITTSVEQQTIQMEQALAVMDKVADYFDSDEKIKYLPM